MQVLDIGIDPEVFTVRPSGKVLSRALATAVAGVTLNLAIAVPAVAAGTTPTATCASFGTGATGGAVRGVQKLVGVPVDGQFGSATAKALRAWQTGHKLTASGVVDAATWAAIPAAKAQHICARKVHGAGVVVGCAKLASGSNGLAVAVLQRALKITVDGQFGPGTTAALKAAQTSAKLTPSGTTDRPTWTALLRNHTPVCTARTTAPPRPADYKAQQKVRAQTDQLAATLVTEPGTTTNQIALAAMAFEKKQIGKPYAWGGIGPKSYDCSGLQMTSYQHAGLTLPRVAADQYTGSGPSVPLDQAQQGDLLFYASDVTKPETIYHVVMYVGGGDVLDAPHTGAKVSIRPLWTTDLLPVAVRPVAGLTLPAKLGATGWTVTQLQQALNRHGNTLTVDGGYGPTTKSAVQTWQANHGLKATGVVGIKTWLTFG
jgi:cell wall-associated NlpC family hydrolase